MHMVSMDRSIFMHFLLEVCFLSLQVNFVAGRIPKSTSEIEGYLFNCFPCGIVQCSCILTSINAMFL